MMKFFTPFLLLLLGPILLFAQASDTSYLDLGGALRFNGFYKNWKGQEANQAKGGDLDFDTWRINAKAQYDHLFLSAEYRFYPGYNMLKEGYVGYRWNKGQTEVQLGVNQVPFGNLPYGSHNWFFMIPYYIGLEDDHDAGVKLKHQTGDWTFHGAFYKNSEGHYSGSSESSARYSYDILGDNEEVNQFNGRVAYQWGNTEIGFSAQYGQLFNTVNEEFGDQQAFAAHLNGDYGPWNVKAQAIIYDYDPVQTAAQEPFVIMGAYDFPYQVAKRGRVYVGGISYDLPVDWGPITKLTFYENFSYFNKTVSGYNDAQMNVAGCMITAGPIYSYVDVAMGQSHPWIGPVWSEALSRGIDPNAESGTPEDKNWATRFNVNIGYYF